MVSSSPSSQTLNLQEHPGRDDRMYFDKPGEPVASLQWSPKVRSYPMFWGTICPKPQLSPAGLRSLGKSRQLWLPRVCLKEDFDIQSLAVTSMLKSFCFLPYKQTNKNYLYFFWLLRIFHTKIFEEKFRSFGGFIMKKSFFQNNIKNVVFLWVESPISSL